MRGLPSLGLVAAFATRGLSETVFRKPPTPGPQSDYSDNPTYQVGETVELEWVTDLDKVTVYLWQDFPPASNVNAMQYYETTDTRVQWTVNIPGSFSTFRDAEGKSSVVVYFALYGTGATSWATTCHYFNITDSGEPERSSTKSEESETSTTLEEQETSTDETTTVEVSSTSTQATNSDSTSSAANETASTDGSEGNSSSSTDLSAGAVAGISIGSTLGVLVLGVAVGFFIWRRYRNKRQPRAEQPSSTSVGGQPASPSPEKHNLPSQLDSQALHEMHSNPRPAPANYGSPPVASYGIQGDPVQPNTAYELPPGSHGVRPGTHELPQDRQPPQSYELHHDYIPPEMEGSRPNYQPNSRQ